MDVQARGGTLILGGGFAGSTARLLRKHGVYQLPTTSRKLRVVTDWTVALLFRRDIAELGQLGHPRPLGDA